MAAHTGMSGEPKYTYLQIEQNESDAESEEQEDLWVNKTALDVFQAESYAVQQTEKVSRGIRGNQCNANLQMRPNWAGTSTIEKRPMKGVRKDCQPKCQQKNEECGQYRWTDPG